MEITVNQQTVEIEENCSVATLLIQLPNLPANGLAVAVNQQVITRSAWPDSTLQAGDKVMIIRATQGG